jgi:hypothetical protein
MVNVERFIAIAPDAEDSAVLALVLINNLLRLLKEKGIVDAGELVDFLEKTAVQLDGSQSAPGLRGAKFIRSTMLKEL